MKDGIWGRGGYGWSWEPGPGCTGLPSLHLASSGCDYGACSPPNDLFSLLLSSGGFHRTLSTAQHNSTRHLDDITMCVGGRFISVDEHMGGGSIAGWVGAVRGAESRGGLGTHRHPPMRSSSGSL